MLPEVQRFLDQFSWESEDQKKGVFALLKELRNRLPMSFWNGEPDKNVQILLMTVSAWFIQKDHDSHEWMMEMLGRKFAETEQEILRLRNALERAGVSVTTDRTKM